MTVSEWPDHLLSLEEFEALSGDNSRHYELQEGNLYVRPLPGSAHQMALFEVAVALRQQLPPQWRVVPAVEVITRATFPPTVRVPDVLVVAEDVLRAKPARFAAQEVALAVEVIATGSRNTDTVTKPIEYAQAGIPHYWVVDTEEPVSITTYRLGGNGRYEKGQAVTGVLSTTEPFPVSLDLTELPSTQRRRVDQ